MLQQQRAVHHCKAILGRAAQAVAEFLTSPLAVDQRVSRREHSSPIERLETRAMLAGNPPPVAKLSATALTSWTNSYTFKLTYTDDQAVRVATIDNNDIVVTGPNDYSRSARLVSVTGSGKSVVAKYKVSAPDAIWDGDSNGSYSVFVRAAQVTDTKGKAVVPNSVGNFTVAVTHYPSDSSGTSSLSSVGAYAANVRDFGAIPNDGVDDTSAIQRAIDSLIDSSVGEPNGASTIGGIVYIPAGNYTVNHTLTIDSGIVLMGDGASTVLSSRSRSASDSVIRFQSRQAHGYVENAGVKNLNIDTLSAKGVDAAQNAAGDLIDLQLSDLNISSGATAIDFHGRDVYELSIERVNVVNPGSSALWVGIARTAGNSALNRVEDFAVKGTARSTFTSTDPLVYLFGDYAVDGLTISDIGTRVLPLSAGGLQTYARLLIQTATSNLTNGAVASFSNAKFIDIDTVDNLGAGRVLSLNDVHQLHVDTYSLNAGASLNSSAQLSGSSHLIIEKLTTPATSIGSVVAGVDPTVFSVRSITVSSSGSTSSSTGSSGQTGVTSVSGASDSLMVSSSPVVRYAAEYGAIGNDSLDDTTAIQNAINSLPVGNGISSSGTNYVGGTIVLPTGILNTSRSLTVPSGVWIVGTGYQTVLRNSDSNTANAAIVLVPGSAAGYNVGAGVNNLQMYTVAAAGIRADASNINGVFDLQVHDIVMSAGGMSIDMSRVKTYHSSIQHIGIVNSGSTAIWMGDDAGYSADNLVSDIHLKSGNRSNYVANRAVFVFEGQLTAQTFSVEQVTAKVLPIYISGNVTMNGVWLEVPPASIPDNGVVIDINNASSVHVDRMLFLDAGRFIRVRNSTDVHFGMLDISGTIGQLSNSFMVDNNSQVTIDSVNSIRDAGMLDSPNTTVRGVFCQYDGSFVDATLLTKSANLVASIANWTIDWGDALGTIVGTATIEQAANGPHLTINILSNPNNRNLVVRASANVPANLIGKHAIASWRVDTSGPVAVWTSNFLSQYNGRATNSLTASVLPGTLTGSDQMYIWMPYTAGVTSYSISNVSLIAIS